MAAVRVVAAFLLLFCGCVFGISPPGCKPSTVKSFTVDYSKHTFVKDGCPFFYVAGSIHYSRVPRVYWQDRLQKMAAAGLDAVQVYIPWNAHERSPGVYDFSGQQDVVTFLQMAQREGLLVILRAGPYICGEWDFGGFPAWLLQKNGSIVLRTMDPGYIAPVDRWFDVLLPKLKPLLYSEGGPVIMVQVENEYGSYFACDHAYIDHLGKSVRAHLGDDIILFTTDGDGVGYLKCGANPNLLPTVDFGPSANASKNFDALRKFAPDGPLVNSEFYTGWLDYWGHPHAHGSTSAIVKTLKQMLDLKASVNMYMFEGGTNFGYTNGADPPFNICPTSYDYDAPLSEAGDTTEKYHAIRQLIMQYKNLTHEVPANTTKRAYGQVQLKRIGSVMEMLHEVTAGPGTVSTYPKTMEQMGQSGGFIVYGTTLKKDYPGNTLNGTGVRDRAHVFVDGQLRGLIDRNLQTTMTLTAAKGQSLQLFIENQGHINFGSQINHNSKGLISNLTLGGDILTDWAISPLNMTRLALRLTHQTATASRSEPRASESSPTPAVYGGSFQLPQSDKSTADTYLNVSGWFKGQAFINGFNLGRYWPVRGPQVTLYVPASVLKPYPTRNSLMLLELDHVPCDLTTSTTKRRDVTDDVTKRRDVMSGLNNVMKQDQGRSAEDACVVTLVDRPMISGPYRPFKVTRSGKELEINDWRRGRGE